MTDRENDIVVAGEYALGLLEGEERQAAENRLASEPAFAADVGAWTRDLAPLLAAGNAQPSETVWDRIESRLAANDDTPASSRDARLGRWRAAAGAASAIAASLALVLLSRGPAPAPQTAPAPQAQPAPTMVASLEDEERGSAVAISVEDRGRGLVVVPVRLLTQTRSAELWVIPSDGTPRSLGVIDNAAPSRVDIAPRHREHLRAGATLAISLEPAGGSPTGSPTGPIAASGKINLL